MFTVHLSDSPLLDYINYKSYRDLEVHGLTATTGKEVYDNVMVLIGNMDLSAHEYYMTWLSVWKQINARLSVYNHHLKRPNNYSTVYENIFRASERQICREWDINSHLEYDNRREFIKEEFEARREQYLAWTEKALTAMYNARANGKLATSQIVMLNRIQAGRKTSPGFIARFFGLAA